MERNNILMEHQAVKKISENIKSIILLRLYRGRLHYRASFQFLRWFFSRKEENQIEKTHDENDEMRCETIFYLVGIFLRFLVTHEKGENQSIIFLSLLLYGLAIYGYQVFELYTHIFETMDNVVMF